MLSITTNLDANAAADSLSSATSAKGVSMQQLSTGKKAVDAATSDGALSITLSTQTKSLGQARANAKLGEGYLNVMSGALNEHKEVLQSLHVLATQAQTAGYTADDRAQMQEKVSVSLAELNRNANVTTFNGESLINGVGDTAATITGGPDLAGADWSGTAASFDIKLNGLDGVNISLSADMSGSTPSDVLDAINTKIDATTLKGKVTASLENNKLVLTTTEKGSGASLEITNTTGAATVIANTAVTNGTNGAKATFHVGYNESTTNDIEIQSKDLTTSGLGINAIDISTVAGAKTADTALLAALKTVGSAGNEFGAVANRLQLAEENMGSVQRNTNSALSSLVDTDFASTTANLAKESVLSQAASAMLTQANAAPKSVIQLLRG